MHKAIKYVPNCLSCLRIILSIVFAWLFFHGFSIMSLIVFFIAAISDFLDGYWARRWRVVSSFGAAIDPVADKILIMSVYFILALHNIIPDVISIIVIMRDIIILSTVILCYVNKIALKISPIKSSKINTTIQLLYVFLVLYCNFANLHIPSIQMTLGVCVIVSTLWSGIEYAQKYKWIWPHFFRF